MVDIARQQVAVVRDRQQAIETAIQRRDQYLVLDLFESDGARLGEIWIYDGDTIISALSTRSGHRGPSALLQLFGELVGYVSLSKTSAPPETNVSMSATSLLGDESKTIERLRSIVSGRDAQPERKTWQRIQLPAKGEGGSLDESAASAPIPGASYTNLISVRQKFKESAADVPAPEERPLLNLSGEEDLAVRAEGPQVLARQLIVILGVVLILELPAIGYAAYSHFQFESKAPTTDKALVIEQIERITLARH